MTLLTIQNGEIPLKLFYNYRDVLLNKKNTNIFVVDRN